MLILTRKTSETVVIGEGPNAVEVMVVSIAHGRVKLGIVAPNDVPVSRKELLKQGANTHVGEGSPVPAEGLDARSLREWTDRA